MGEIIYEAFAQYVTIFFFVVMVLPAVIIFLWLSDLYRCHVY